MHDDDMDLDRVRRELDVMCMRRASGVWTEQDRSRFRELCLLEDRLRRAA